MISFEPFWKTMDRKGISTYKLDKVYNLSRSLIDRLKHDKPITTVTLDDLCKLFDCEITDVVKFKKD